MQPLSAPHATALVAHLLLFVYWLGMPPFVDGFRKLATTGAGDADNWRTQASLAKAVLGVMRPGAA